MKVSPVSTSMQMASNATQVNALHANALNSNAIHEQPEFAKLLSPNPSDEERVDSGQPIPSESSDELKKAFNDFVGQTFFTELIKAYRSTQQPAAYFDGGRAEKIFQGQLDQIFAEELSESSSEKIAEPMFEQFKLRR